MIINILNNVLHSIDLVIEAGLIFAKGFLASDFPFNLIEPLVEVIQILASLTEFFLDGLLQLYLNAKLDICKNNFV